MSYVPRLKAEYKERVIKALIEEFSYNNVMQVPKLEKIVVSKGVGAAIADKKLIDYAVEELTTITGQKAISTMSKKDVASFKLRKGMPIGAKVTLRGDKMYEFLDRHNVKEEKRDLIIGLARGSIGKAKELYKNDEFLNKRNKIYDFLKEIHNVTKVDIFSEVNEWVDLLKEDFPLFDLLSVWYRDIIIYKRGNKKQLVNSDYEDTILKKVDKYNLNELLTIIDLIETHEGYIDRNAFKDLTLQVLLLKIKEKRL